MTIHVDAFLEAAAARRSIYGIGNEEVVDRDRISAIVGTALRLCGNTSRRKRISAT